MRLLFAYMHMQLLFQPCILFFAPNPKYHLSSRCSGLGEQPEGLELIPVVSNWAALELLWLLLGILVHMILYGCYISVNNFFNMLVKSLLFFVLVGMPLQLNISSSFPLSKECLMDPSKCQFFDHTHGRKGIIFDFGRSECFGFRSAVLFYDADFNYHNYKTTYKAVETFRHTEAN